MDAIIHRLMRELDDGSFEISGYERPSEFMGWEYSHDMNQWFPFYISHTRKDRWTGLKYEDGRMMFERDIVTMQEDGRNRNGEYTKERMIGIILYNEYTAGFFCADIKKNGYSCSIGLEGDEMHFLGIEGVKEA